MFSLCSKNLGDGKIKVHKFLQLLAIKIKKIVITDKSLIKNTLIQIIQYKNAFKIHKFHAPTSIFLYI